MKGAVKAARAEAHVPPLAALYSSADMYTRGAGQGGGPCTPDGGQPTVRLQQACCWHERQAALADMTWVSEVLGSNAAAAAGDRPPTPSLLR